jgi:hypothetical protein
MIEEWRRLFPDDDVETQLRPVYPFNGPGGPIVLYDGPVGGIAECEQPCRVELAFDDKPSIRWSVEPGPHDFWVSTGSADLGLRRGERDWTVTAHHNTPDSGWINRT